MTLRGHIPAAIRPHPHERSSPLALKFVVLLGVVSLFADMTYEAARSITGPYLALLGASGTIVGFVAGFGELIGYGLRLVSGYVADKSGQYWGITIVGYGINLLAVPLLALAGHWEVAACLMIAERMGKAIRTPARDAMLSHATAEMGRGWGFGLHEALDQIGAMLGPLIVAAVLYFRGSYQAGFAVLAIPAVLALSVLMAARFLYPTPRNLESKIAQISTEGFSHAFWFYLAAAGLVAAGYADFPLIAYHFRKTSSVPEVWVPVFYSIAMGADALAALIFGRLFDRAGISILIVAVLFSTLFAPFVFWGGFHVAMGGMML
ncbi:MAG: membrane protein of unknown function [Nitrospira sp.]|nr:MAG: membrane protein of unknown function [Nitrospira sp.]